MKSAVFWDVAPCRSCVNRRYGGTYRLHLQGRNIRERGTSASRWQQSVRSLKYSPAKHENVCLLFGRNPPEFYQTSIDFMMERHTVLSGSFFLVSGCLDRSFLLSSEQTVLYISNADCFCVWVCFGDSEIDTA
jgi:hypothetical protein